MQSDEYVAEIDGSAQPNPGPGGWGVYLEGPGVKKEIHGTLSYTTNNLAEYHALAEAVRLAQSLGARKLTVYTDSELVCKQYNGEWKVQNPRIAKALHQIKEEIEKAGMKVDVRWVRRKKNTRADALSKRWLDSGKTKR